MTVSMNYQAWIDELILAGIDVKTQKCPLCGSSPTLATSPEQVFCGNDDCDVMTWNITMTREELIDNPHIADLDNLLP